MSTTDAKNTSLFAKRLTEERKKLGLTQNKAAEICGVSRRMWGHYEKGRSLPGCEVLFALAQIGADFNFLMNGMRVFKVHEAIGEYTNNPALVDLIKNFENCSEQEQEFIAKIARLSAEPKTTDIAGEYQVIKTQEIGKDNEK